MDKRLIGKWYKEDLGETINIFDETPLRMKISFSSSGYYNFEPNCVYEKDNCLCYEINDEQFRMVYHIHYDNDMLTGYYTQFGKETAVQYRRLSSTPEDGAFEYKPTKLIVPATDMSRIDALKKFASYDKTPPSNPFTVEYALYEPLPDILINYHFHNYVSTIPKDDDNLAFAILDFVCDHFKHDGSIGMAKGCRIEDIITFCEEHDGKTNCRGLAILLASLLRMNGLKAAHITCLPYEDPFDDCHVVVDCFLPSGKRVMIDPTYRLYLKDKQGDYVSLPQLRRMLIHDAPYFANEKASYNGGAFDLEEQRQYMVKNTFRFSRGVVNKDGYDERSSRRVELIPLGYPIENFNDRLKAEFIYHEAAFWQ